MTIRFLASILLFLGMLSQARPGWAQADFKPGYIVALSGDTIRGQVQLRGALRSASLCRVRPAAAAAATDYQPTGLRAYGIDGEALYEARRLPLAEGVAASPVLFLELLAAGRARLYARRDKDDQTHYYLAMSADSVQALRQYRVQRIVNDHVYYETLYPFRNVLSSNFKDCPVVQPSLSKLPLTARNLKQVVNRYNECGSEAVAPARASVGQQRQRVGFGLVAGAERTSLSFPVYSLQHDGSFTTSASPLAGVFLMVVTPALNRNVAFRLDALYEYLHYDASYSTRAFSTVDRRQQVVYKFHSLRLPLHVRYYVQTGHLRPFLLAGVSLNYLLAYDSHLHSEYLAGSSPVVYDGPAHQGDEFTRTDFGMLAGVGLAVPGVAGHALGLELRAERSTGFIDLGDRVTITRIGALLSVNLSK